MASTLTYQYSVRDRGGKIVSGTLEAESQSAVAGKLKQMGYAPISISEHKAGMKAEIKIPGFGGKIKLKDLAVMSRQFAVMINAGLSLLRSLTILSEQTENKVLAGVLSEVRNDIETGTFSLIGSTMLRAFSVCFTLAQKMVRPKKATMKTGKPILRTSDRKISTRVGAGSVPPRSSNSFEKIGTMNSSMPIEARIAMMKTTTGYVIADFTLPRSLTSAS